MSTMFWEDNWQYSVIYFNNEYKMLLTTIADLFYLDIVDAWFIPKELGLKTTAKSVGSKDFFQFREAPQNIYEMNFHVMCFLITF